tara:strand:- start:1413 stop:1607 length:195 start_codon:yes stop_codon:yes gene_type:complete
MKYQETENSIKDPTKTHTSMAYPEWLFVTLLKCRKYRCNIGWHKMKNSFGEKLSSCKWCEYTKI